MMRKRKRRCSIQAESAFLARMRTKADTFEDDHLQFAGFKVEPHCSFVRPPRLKGKPRGLVPRRSADGWCRW